METRSLSRHIGLEVTGLDVKGSTHVDLEWMLRQLADHSVLCFRDQALSQAELVSFSGRFGRHQEHMLAQFTSPQHPEVYVHSNIVEDGRPIGNAKEGFVWHTDLTYMERPTAYTFLYGVEIPPQGGNTDFLSMYAAYESLPPADQDALTGFRIARDYESLYRKRKGVEPLTEAQRQRIVPTYHPAIRTHPVTGRKGFYIGGAAITALLDPQGREADMALHDRMLDHAMSGDFRYSHSWRVGDLIVFDNRGLLHTASDYDAERHRRLVYRTLVEGEVPF